MGILSRSALAVFIFSAIGLWTCIVAEKAEETWVMAVITIGLAVLFVALGAHEENA